VVGAGILGASIAYHLARRGASVTVLEKNGPASGTTKNSFAWLNASGKAPRNYYDFNLAGMLGWRRLELEIGAELPMQWGGGVSWLEATSDQVAERRKRLSQRQSWGYPVYEVDAERVRQLVPGSRPGDMGFGQFCDIEGTVDPVAATKVLVEKAKQLGATLVYPCEVTGLDAGSGKIQGVQTTKGKFEADYLVLAAGNDTPRITKMVGFDVPLIESKGILAHTKPHQKCLERVIMIPGTDAKQHLDGRIVTGRDFGESGNRAPTVELGQSYVDTLSKFLPAAAGAEIEFMTLGYRVMPKDGHPIIDRAPRIPNMHVVAQHSGMTCAPIVGQLVAMEVLDQVKVDLLEPYRLSRFS
jgi:glycine/D-amino acid oxidase-like deaminating enzyme